MSGKGDGSSASSVDLSWREFRAMMYCDYCQGKSFQERFQSLKHCFGDQSRSKATVFRWFRQFMSGESTLEDDDCCGRMAMTVIPENVSTIESLIKKDPKMAYTEVQGIMKISSGSLTRILHDCLGARKRYAFWVPHNLSEEQKQDRVHWCTHMLRKCDGGTSPCVWVIVTGEETWVYQYNLETKQQSEVWVFPNENPPVKFKRNGSASKQMIAYSSKNLATLPPYRLRTERRLRLTGMSTTVRLKFSMHGVNGVPERVSVAYCSIMTMPARTQQL